ncbi:hypothetical protein ACLOJK_038818, partial [Asimina triloba]
MEHGHLQGLWGPSLLALVIKKVGLRPPERQKCKLLRRESTSRATYSQNEGIEEEGEHPSRRRLNEIEEAEDLQRACLLIEVIEGRRSRGRWKRKKILEGRVRSLSRLVKKRRLDI